MFEYTDDNGQTYPISMLILCWVYHLALLHNKGWRLFYAAANYWVLANSRPVMINEGALFPH